MKRIDVSLSSNDIDKLVKEIEAMSKRIEDCSKRFCEKLADVGIKVAEANSFEYGPYIIFSKTNVKIDNNGVCECVMYGMKTEELMREWWYHGQIIHEFINPLLMAEFGSGHYAKNPLGIPGVGQGSYPNPNNPSNATSPIGWHWTDPDGTYHHIFGEEPGQPMYRAREAMIQQISSIAREVFSNVV